MKAVISSTYDSKYLYFLPIVTWCWNKLGVDVICFMPNAKTEKDLQKLDLCARATDGINGSIYAFNCPEHKEATYAQCSRLYGACLDLPEDEILITGDVDMAMFQIPPYIDKITIFGSDLVPDGQFPMCYASGTVKEWRSIMQLHEKTYQQCLHDLLGEIEADHFRGNYWGKDQQTLWENVKDNATLIPRARPNTQFANNRVDRDDMNWRAYVDDSLVDAHLWRPGFQEGNFENIMELLTMKYPNDNFQWLLDYNNAYKKLL
jgi:hypothetical protein